MLDSGKEDEAFYQNVREAHQTPGFLDRTSSRYMFAAVPSKGEFRERYGTMARIDCYVED
jgi:hypothetical protein